MAGATQRLPRLIGIKKALDIIPTGKLINADEGYDIGIIDEIINIDTTHSSSDSLVDAAITFALSNKVQSISVDTRRLSSMNKNGKKISYQNNLLSSFSYVVQ